MLTIKLTNHEVDAFGEIVVQKNHLKQMLIEISREEHLLIKEIIHHARIPKKGNKWTQARVHPYAKELALLSEKDIPRYNKLIEESQYKTSKIYRNS